jgi:tetratricopeptide (TPR) repeat protein
VNTARTVAGPDPAEVHDARYLLTRAAPGDAARALEVLAPFARGDRIHPAAAEAIADAWLVRARAGRAVAFAHAEAAARRALAADPSRAGAWRVLSSVRLLRDRDPAAAARFAARAVRLAPRDPAAHLTSAAADAVRGRDDAAIAAAAEAIRLDPGRWRLRADLAFFLLAARRYDAALEASRAALALEPGSTTARDLQLTAAERLGRWDEARNAALALMSAAGADPSAGDAVRRAAPRDGVALYRRWQISVADRLAAQAGWPPMTAAAIYAAAGQAARAVEWLRRADAARDPMLVFLPAFRDFDPIRDDPAFRAFTASVG